MSEETKQLNDKEWEVLKQCLIAAIEGPFFKGLMLDELVFEVNTCLSEEQLKLILKYWPDLDSYELQVEFERIQSLLDEKSAKLLWESRKLKASPRMKKPTRLRIYNGVESCLYILIREMVQPRNRDTQWKSLAAWNEYLDLTPWEVYAICLRWQQKYCPYLS